MEPEEIERYTWEQALAMAGSEASRDLRVSEDAIQYVAFIPEFADYCLCEFLPEDGGWVKLVRLLTPTERLPGEEIPDERIVELARSGQLISAIRLFRAKHQVGLIEGKQGVERLLNQS